MNLLKRHWDLGVGLAVAIYVYGFWTFPEHFNPWVIVAIAAAAGLIVAKIVGSLGLIVRLVVFVVRETLIQPNRWTIIGGLVGAVWCLDFATLRWDDLSAGQLGVAAGIGYPLGALVALLPRGLVQGFGALKLAITPRRKPTSEANEAG